MQLHPDIATLAGDYLERLASSHRTVGGARIRSRFFRPRRRRSRELILWKLLATGFVGAVIGTVLIVAWLPDRAQTKPPFAFPPPPRRPAPAAKAIAAVQPADTEPGSPRMAEFFRAEFLRSVKRELAKIEKSADDAALQRIVQGLPDDLALFPSGLATRVLFGAWSKNDHDRCVAAIEQGLKNTKLGLTDEQITVVALGAVPKPSRAEKSGSGDRHPNDTRSENASVP
jgi:hypothetical protein